jgi:hypothetical protein
MPTKAQERFYLDVLRRALPEFPSGEVIDSETPDFLITTETEVIGLEFTVFHLQPASGERPHQELQSLKDRAVTRAAMIHEARGGDALYVSVFFLKSPTLNKFAVDPLAQGIADAVPSVGQSAPENEVDFEVPWHALPPGIAHIAVRRSIDGSISSGTRTQVDGWPKSFQRTFGECF